MPRKRKVVNEGGVLNGWISLLKKHIPGFKSLEWNDQYHLAKLLDRCDRKRYRHDRGQGTTIPYQEIYKRFGKSLFQKINDTLHIFDIAPEKWGKAGNETRCYWPSEKAQLAKDEFFRSSLPKKRSAIIRHTGDTMVKPDRAIASRTQKDNNIKNSLEGMPPALVPVNIDNLLLYAKSLKRAIEKRENESAQLELFTDRLPSIEKMEYQRRFAVGVIRHSYTTLSNKTELVHKYRESEAGRLYAEGTNLQTAPRNIRKAALQGCYDYDMENCHYSLFQQLADRAGYQSNAVREYLTNKKEVRAEIARLIDRPIDAVKQCLVAIIYGAKNTAYSSEYFKQPALPKYLGGEAAEAFREVEIVKALFREVREGGKAIIKNQSVGRRGYIKNAMGCGINIETDKKPTDHKKIMAHLLQGLEAKMLEIARKTYPGKILLLQHDGFTCAAPVNIRLLEKAITTQLGYRMEFSEEQLQIPANWLPEDAPNANSETGFSLLESMLCDEYPDVSDS